MTNHTATAPLAALVRLLGEIGDLKRVRAAGLDGSVASTAFLRSWAALALGADVGAVARTEVRRALVATRLGAIDDGILAQAGLEPAARRAVTEAALADALAAAGPWQISLSPFGDGDSADVATTAGAPCFAHALAAQPRAAAASPDRPRVMVEPPENHAEHCITVAIYAALLAPSEGADTGIAFLAGLTHHLHNAVLPDAGFLGESLLGGHLEAIVERLTDDATSQLPADVAADVQAARSVIADADTPEGRAFHSADVLDRVLQARHHARAAAFTLEQALDELDLVHAGPLQAYHQKVLAEAGLWG